MTPADLRGRTAIVTGAARNIGRAIAEGLAAAGARVLATDSDAAALEEAFPGAEVETMTLDLEQEGSSLAELVLQRFGSPDLIVNNVGITTGHTFLELAESDFDRVVQTNLRGPWFLTRGLTKELIRSRRPGSVVFLSSLHDHRVRLTPHYSATKAAVAMLVREMAYELGPHSIRVNAVSPGWVPAKGARVKAKEVAKLVPLGRPGLPEDVAKVALVLLSDELSGYVTGANVPVDGGLDLYNWLTG